MVKGASTPISLYSYDLTLERLQEDDVFLFATAPLTKNTADTAGPSKRSEGILGRKGTERVLYTATLNVNIVPPVLFSSCVCTTTPPTPLPPRS